MDPEQNPECNGLKREWEVRKSMEWGWNSFRDSYFVSPRPKAQCGNFSGGSAVKNLPASVGDTGLIPDSGNSHIPQSN